MRVSINRELLLKRKLPVAAVTILKLLLLAVAVSLIFEPTQANHIINVYNDISPPEGAQPPIITIQTPINGSSYPNDVILTFDVTAPRIVGDEALDAITKVYYKASWEAEEVLVAEKRLGSFSIDLSNVRGGNLSVTIYAVGEGLIQTGEDFREENGVVYSYNYYDRFELIGYSTVSFVKDLIPPKLTVLSPQNRTYTTSDVNLDFTVNEATSEMLYCLDDKENQTVTGNVTLTGLENGAHKVTIYVADLAGNPVIPTTVYFNVDSPTSLIMTIVASIAIVAVVSLGFLVYFKKRKH
jgi:hypothetical protein